MSWLLPLLLGEDYLLDLDSFEGVVLLPHVITAHLIAHPHNNYNMPKMAIHQLISTDTPINQRLP